MTTFLISVCAVWLLLFSAAAMDYAYRNRLGKAVIAAHGACAMIALLDALQNIECKVNIFADFLWFTNLVSAVGGFGVGVGVGFMAYNRISEWMSDN